LETFNKQVERFGLESIQFQTSEYKDELIPLFKKLLGLGKHKKAYYFTDVEPVSILEDIEEVVYKHVGIKVMHYSNADSFYSAMPITLKMNTSIMRENVDNYNTMIKHQSTILSCDSRDAVNNSCLKEVLAKKFVDSVDSLERAIKKGYIEIDLENGRVNNMPKDVVGVLLADIGGMIASDFSAQAMAAMLTHEVGHMVVALEQTMTVTTKATSLADTVRNMNGSVIDKVKLIGDAYNVNIKESKIDVVNIIRLQKALMESVEFTNSSKSNIVDFENQADNFAVRYGFGKELLDAVIDVEKYYNPPDISSYIMLVYVLIFSVINGVVMGGAMIMILVLQNQIMNSLFDNLIPWVRGTDPFVDRMDRIEKEVRANLRLNDTGDLLDTLDTIDYIKKRKKKMGPNVFSKAVADMLSFSCDDLCITKKYENLIDNRLYEYAEKFKRLNK
jgi:hypothetical protein